MSNSIVTDLRIWLGPRGLHLFRTVDKLYGTPIATLRLNYRRRRIPAHGMHFREGMAIRNFLRTRKECSGWSAHDYDNRYIEILTDAVRGGKLKWWELLLRKFRKMRGVVK